jgi:hypothetical protein
MNNGRRWCCALLGLVSAGCSPAPLETALRGEGALVAGHAATESEYPSTVYLGCTAAKVGPRHILLAAHCVHDDASNTVFSYYGADAKLDFTVGNDATAPDLWFEVPIQETHIFSEWTDACEGGCDGVWAFDPPHPPDVALIVLEEDTPTIPIARVDASTAVVGDDVVITGYGCEEGYGGPGANPPRFKLEQVELIAGDALEHDNSIIEAALIPDLMESYVITPGPELDDTAAGLCPGDSGGPLYRELSNEQLVVGVNAYYSFPADSGVPMTNWHTRLDEDANFPVLSWLEGLGAVIRRDGAEPSARGGAAHAIPGTLQAEDYDEGGEGVGYHDLDPSNRPAGHYRNEGVDLEPTDDDGQGFDVTFSGAGEWLNYSLVAEAEALFTLELRVASQGTGHTLRALLDGDDVSGSLSVPDTGGGQTFQTLSTPDLRIGAGPHELRLVFETGDVSANWLRFSLQAPTCGDALKNGAEPDVDCGAACPTQCAQGQDCTSAGDCQSQNCFAGSCQAPAPMGGMGGQGGGAGTGDSPGSAGSGGSAGSAGSAGFGGVPVVRSAPAPREDSGCGCRVIPTRSPGSALLLVFAVLGGSALGRRRRAQRP